MRKLNYYKCVFLWVFLCLGNLTFSQTVHEQIMESVRTELHIKKTTIDGDVQGHLATIQANGSWADLNYNDTDEPWEPITHLNRLRDMADAYSSSESSYYNNFGLYEAIVDGLNFYHNTNPEAPGVFFSPEITEPTLLCKILILARAGTYQIPTTLENNILTRLDNMPAPYPNRYTGTNRLWYNLWYFYKGLLKDNASEVTYATSDSWNELMPKTTEVEGLQQDLTYFQHGAQLNLHTYGRNFINNINSMAGHLIGTTYGLNDSQKLESYKNYLTVGPYGQAIRGEYISFNVVGRDISRPDKTDGQVTPYINAKILDPSNAAQYDIFKNRLSGSAAPSANVTVRNSYGYRSQFTTHNRTNYNFDIRANSYRTKKTESFAGDNRKGLFLTEGATNIMVDGDEYFNIFPAWDWNKIPGTTAPAYTGSKLLPTQGTGETGNSTFSGGVSDGTYGLQVFRMIDYQTQAKKAWFLFDEEVVCLGAGISATATEGINTTINQCHLDGSVVVSQGGSTSTLSTGGHTLSSNVDWVLHDKVGYFIPNGGNLKLRNQVESGYWQDINTRPAHANEALVTTGVFKFWFDHGVNPSNASYAYIVAPGKTTVQEMNNYNLNAVQILRNDANIQAVKHNTLDMMQVVFHTPGTLIAGDITLEVDKACALILKNISTANVSVSAADPSESYSSLKVSWSSSSISPMRELQLNLPQTDVFKGSTVQGVIDLSLPAQNSTIVKQYPTHDAYVENGTSSGTNFGSADKIIVKNGNVSGIRNGFLRFNLSGVNPGATLVSATLRMKVRGNYPDATLTTWDVSSVTDDSWTEGAITWDTKPASSSVLDNQPGQASGYVQWDVTSFVNAQLSGDGKVSLRISSTSVDSSTYAAFFSKENGDINDRPVLELEYANPKVGFYPTHDAYVENGTSSGTNFGSADKIIVKNGNVSGIRNGFLKFSLSEVSPDATLASATLKMKVRGNYPDATLTTWEVSSVTDDNWTEGTITWDTKPASSSVLDTQPGQASGYVEWDVTSFVNAQLSGDKKVSLRISSTSLDASTYAAFFSKENSNDSDKPFLELEFATPEVGFYPLHDAYVENGTSSGTNFGSADKIIVKNGNVSGIRNGFLKFNLSGVNSGGTVASATLKMKIKGNYPNATITSWDVSSVSNDIWTEDAITWDNKPPSSSVLDNQPGQASGYVEWDVTNFVNSQLSGDGKVSLRVSSTSMDSSTYTEFFSKENPNGDDRPVLKLNYSSSSAKPAQNTKLNETTLEVNEETDLAKIQVYPNPADSEFTVQSKTPIAQLYIIDLSGKTLKVINGLKSTNLNVDVSNLHTGMYFVRTYLDDGSVKTNKVVIK
ncbi:DNRLRE domain-containing protein [Gaetbulibacter sp. M240]|uniref:CBM96 family carbohydrate-binding protein n=1 Tax=Gaetbulibacter sp. M240 TaxID=3126511 RepID=UPI00374F8890